MSTGSFRFAGVGLAGARAFAPEPEKALDMARDAIRKLRIVVHAAPPSPRASEAELAVIHVTANAPSYVTAG